MRAWRLHAHAPVDSAPLRLEEIPDPQPGPGEVVVRVHACAVCRTDLHVVAGELSGPGRPPPPLVPGHMVVGRVESLGPGVERPRVGTRVGVAWLQGTCGTCRECRRGAENLCRAPTFTGWHVDGGYAERVRARADWVYPLPDAFDDLSAAPLLCSGIIGHRALALSGARPGQRLGLIGFGSSAHLVAQIAVHRGCELACVSRDEPHRALARELGAAWAGPIEALEPGSLDAAILFAPVGALVPPVLRALRPGGTLACAGIHMSPIPSIDYAAELFDERVLRSVTANTRADARALLAEAAAIPLVPRVTRYRFERANEALADLAGDRVTGTAVLVP